MVKTGFNWNRECPRFLADVSGHGRCDIVGFGIDGVWVARSDGSGGFLQAELACDGFARNKGSWHVDKHVRLVAQVKGRQPLAATDASTLTAGRAASGAAPGRTGHPPGAPIASRLGDSIVDRPVPGDLVGFGDDGVWVALNSGDGTFGAVQLAVSNFGVNQSWLVDRDVRLLTDLNAKGRDSIVGFGEEGVWITLNDGHGSFNANLQFVPVFGFTQGWHLPDHPRFTADLNGTGSADLIGFGEDAVWVAFNDGQGGFAPPAQSVLSDMCYSRGWRTEHPRFAARLTQNRGADLIGFGPDDVWIARNNADNSFGVGQLARPANVNNLCYKQGWRVGRHPRFVADLAGKGHADLLGFGDDDVWIARNDGNGNFGPAQPGNLNNLCYNQGWRVDLHPRFLADVTGDGRPDIVGFGADGVWVALNKGDGTFWPAQFVLNDFGLESLPRIDYVFVLIMENRSFDHMLGMSGVTGTDAETGEPTPLEGLTGQESNPLSVDPPSPTTFSVGPGAPDRMPLDPGHDFFDVLEELAGPRAVDAWKLNPGLYPPLGTRDDGSAIRIDNSGFVQRYVEKGGTDPDLIMRCFGPGELPVLQQLANEFVVCDHWFSSLPGATWPNRFFAHAASSGGLDDNPSQGDIAAWGGLMAGPLRAGFGFQHGTIYDALSRAGYRYNIYSGDGWPVVAALKGVQTTDYVYSMIDDMLQDEVGQFVYVHIEPDYDIFSHFAGDHSQHPVGSVGRGEAFIKYVYEQIRNSPFWESSLLIITWDEHGGFFDHVPPPPTRPPGDSPDDPSHNKHGFLFDRLGVRVPAIVISPWIPKNLIDHRVYDHASIPATIERITGIDPLTDRDRFANSVTTLLTLMAPRSDTPTTLVSSSQSLRLAQPVSAGPSHPADSINEGEVAAFLSSAVAQDLKVSAPEERAAVLHRIRDIKTHADAWAYMREVEQKITARRGSLANMPAGNAPRVGPMNP